MDRSDTLRQLGFKPGTVYDLGPEHNPSRWLLQSGQQVTIGPRDALVLKLNQRPQPYTLQPMQGSGGDTIWLYTPNPHSLPYPSAEAFVKAGLALSITASIEFKISPKVILQRLCRVVIGSNLLNSDQPPILLQVERKAGSPLPKYLKDRKPKFTINNQGRATRHR